MNLEMLRYDGHPMLAPATVASVNQRKYQPFEVDGKPAPVVTFVTLTFTLGPRDQPGEGPTPLIQASLLFEDSFWMAEESAQAALGKGDYTAAEPQLNGARDALASVSDRSYPAERWQWLISMGRLTMGRKNYEEAEPYYKQALELRQNGDKDAPEIAATLADLGRLYAEEKRYDLARDHASRSVAIYQKNFKKAGSNHPDTQEIYGRAIAYQSWMLSKIALQQNDHIEAGKQCHTVLDFQTFLSTTNH
jgi:tetratricopeptide (TPR) repeat protein